jgi:hypothetical protein
LAVGCAGTQGSRTSAPNLAVADILWLPAEARLEKDAARPILVRDGRSIYIDGTGAVAFTISAPREELSTRLVEHFAAEGWRQRATQHLNPEIPTSFEIGWQSQCACVVALDAEGKPVQREPYHKWHGEWENAQGDIVEYMLGGEGERLRGYAAYIPHSVVEEVPDRQRRLGR